MAAPIQQGHLAFAEYVGFPGVIHTRLAVDRISGDEWIVCTPDLDLYPEELSSGNSDFNRFWHMADGALPPRVPRNQIFAFQPMSPQQYARVMQRGQALGQAERDARGIAAAAMAAPAGVGPAPGGGDAGGDAGDKVWVLAEMVKGHKIGEEVALPPNAPRDGDHALVRINDDGGVEHTVRAPRSRLNL